MGRDKDRLIGKTKAAFTSKTEQGIHSLCLTDGQPGVQQSPGNAPLSFSSPSFIYWPMHHMLWNIPLVSRGPSCPCCVPSHLLECLQPPCWWDSVRGRKVLDSALLSSNTPVLSILCTAQIRNLHSYQLPWRKASLS